MPQLDYLAVAIEHPLRRKILEELRDGPMFQAELGRRMPVAYNSTLKHLACLERAGLVVKTKVERGQYEYALQTAPLNELLAWVSTLYPGDDNADTVPAMPNTADDQLRNAVQSFVDDMSDLIRQAALEAVQDAVGGQVTRRRPLPARPRGAAAGRPARRLRKRGQKRTPEDLARTTGQLLKHIQKNPGKRIEEIAAAMGVGSKELALPAKKLITAKKVKTKGQKRATTYWAR